MASTFRGLLGEKLGMTQVFDENNRIVPVTVVKAGPCVVTQVRTPEVDGYSAVQLGFGEIDPRKVNKPEGGHFTKAGVTPRRHVVELRTEDAGTYTVGQELTAEVLDGVATVDVIGTSKGKGTAGATSGTATLPGDLFDREANVALLHQVVNAQLAAARQGTHATKTRGQVSGGGAKPYRQKGTGRARQGSTRAPQFAGGGVVHGPTPRDYTKKTPKKMKAAALRGALSDRAREGRVHVVSAFVDGDAPKTKAALATLNAITQAKRVLVVLDRDDVLNWVSLRNAPQVHLIEAGQLNTYDVLVSDEVVFTEAALAEFVDGRSKALP